jgi:septal ring factor EnvC (AmiA/AmiB activator)
MHLGEYARGRALAPSELTASNGSIVITNKTVERLGDLGSLTSGLYTLRPVDRPVIRREADDAQTLAKRQAHWRKLVDAQRDNIVKTETELALLDAKIDSLEEAAFHGGRGAARIWARHDEAKQQRTIVERRLDREKAKLAAIVRQARRVGAQPGWFR